MLCYDCRATIDNLATRCPYCTSAVEMYSGNQPKVPSNEPLTLPRRVSEQENNIQGMMLIVIAALIAWAFHSWYCFAILVFIIWAL